MFPFRLTRVDIRDLHWGHQVAFVLGVSVGLEIEFCVHLFFFT